MYLSDSSQLEDDFVSILNDEVVLYLIYRLRGDNNPLILEKLGEENLQIRGG